MTPQLNITKSYTEDKGQTIRGKNKDNTGRQAGQPGQGSWRETCSKVSCKFLKVVGVSRIQYVCSEGY